MVITAEQKESTHFKDRFLNMCSPEPNTGCWIWMGYVMKNGYGKFGVTRSKSKLAHRVSYELYRNEIPFGLHIDHLCRNRCCVNPSHLETVTRQVNTLRGIGVSAVHARKTSCPKGHAYDAKNTYIDNKGSRHCKTCMSYRWVEGKYNIKRKENEQRKQLRITTDRLLL